MKKRNVLTLVLALVLVAALAVGGTLAYFTSQDAEQNTFTMGNVKIDLQESKGETDETGNEIWSDHGLEYGNVLPGNTETKKARVVVDKDSAACYIMVTVNVEADEGFEEADIDALYTEIGNQIGENWEVSNRPDGTLQCVYKESVAPTVVSEDPRETEATPVTLFEQIQIPTSFGNNTANKSFKINLNAYAVQSDNVAFDEVDWDSTDFENNPVVLPN